MAERPLPNSFLHIVTNVRNGKGFLDAARRELGRNLLWSAMIDVPGSDSCTIAFETPADFDPEPFLEVHVGEENDAIDVPPEEPPPAKLFVVNFPPGFTREYCEKLMRACSNRGPALELNDSHPGVIIIKAARPDVALSRLKGIFETFPMPPGEEISVTTRWLDAPVVHFSNLPGDMDVPMFREVFAGFLPGRAKVYALGNRDNHARFHCCVATGDEAWGLIGQLSYGTVSDQEIRVTHFCPHEDLQELQQWNLRVSGVHRTLTLAELSGIFCEYGRILSVFTKADGDRRVIVSLQYIDQAGFENARDRIASDHPGVHVLTPKENGCAVYNFRIGVTDTEVRAVFATVNDVRIEPSQQPGQRPTVWLGFATLAECERAMADCESEFSANLRLWSVPKALDRDDAFRLMDKRTREYERENTVYIPNVPKSVSREDLIANLGQFGRLNCCVLLRPRPPATSLYAFAAFETQAAYEQALAARSMRCGTNSQVSLLDSKTNVAKPAAVQRKARRPL